MNNNSLPEQTPVINCSKTGETVSKLLDWTGIIFMVSMFLVVMAQVISRYVFGNPIVWTEEAARFLMVWMAFAGAVIAMRDKEHIEVTALTSFCSEKSADIIVLVGKIITSAYLIFLIYFGFKYAINNFLNISRITNFSMGIIYLSIPLSCIGMLIYLWINKKGE